MGYYPGLSSASLEITDSTAGADTSLTGITVWPFLTFPACAKHLKLGLNLLIFCYKKKNDEM